MGLRACQHAVIIKLTFKEDMLMKYSTKVSDAVHILAFIQLNPTGSLSSDSIAESIRTNPGCVRQLMSALRKSGLISSVQGHPRPSLAKAPSAITLLDIYHLLQTPTKPLRLRPQSQALGITQHRCQMNLRLGPLGPFEEASLLFCRCLPLSRGLVCILQFNSAAY